MAKQRSKFVCQQCGHEEARWLGRCPACGGWNTLAEEIVPAVVAAPGRGGARAGGWPGQWGGVAGTSAPVPLAGVVPPDEGRLPSGIGEVDRVLGGGIVPGALILIGGDPGIGKSTLLTQICQRVAAAGRTVLYVAGEESARQVKLRADRLGPVPETLLILSETDLYRIHAAVEMVRPDLAVIDSIQTVYVPDLESAPGSVGQVRACAASLMRIAKSGGPATFLVGHINKEGALAGPKVLEHAVDAVLYLEGERHSSFRILRGVKNRFGPTSEIGVFGMGDAGLEGVANPSELFLAERPEGVAGSVVVVSLEGSRPVLVEVQALLSGANYGTPRRTVTGVDYNRVALLLAVLEKRVGLGLGGHDAFVKVVGGLRIDEPAVDLGVAIALASAFKDRPADPRTVVVGEVGLGGEVRAVSRVEERLKEADKLGFRRVILPERNSRAIGARLPRTGLELVGVDTLAEAIEAALL